jgi:glycosidase
MLYKDPLNNVIFLDNHDMTRFYSRVNEDTAKLKMGIAWLLTERGTPEMYYGTEILLKGISNPDGKVRQDFPGGWPSDSANKFTQEGRTKEEESIFAYTKRLANFRKSSSAITAGKMTQYVPEKGVYVYFRYDNKQTVMCVMNTNDSTSTIDLSRFKERIKDFRKGYEVATGTTINFQTTFTVPGKNLLVMELKK